MDKFKYNKRWGQNFLKDQSVLEKIVNQVSVTEDDLIIEIGPGNGALTKCLKRFHAQVVAWEIDERMKEPLSLLEDEITTIVYGDFLKDNVTEVLKNYNYKDLYVIANLPYYITTPIIEKIISSLQVKEMVLMVQNEVADRFAARPGTKSYGSLTVYLNYYFRMEKLFLVNRRCFEPMPHVESAVVRFQRKDEKVFVKNETHFFHLVRNGFRQKRKTLKNNLIGYDWKKVEATLNRHQYTSFVRAEELPLEVWANISNDLQ